MVEHFFIFYSPQCSYTFEIFSKCVHRYVHAGFVGVDSQINFYPDPNHQETRLCDCVVIKVIIVSLLLFALVDIL